MSFRYSPKIITDGLVFYLDAANSNSFVNGSTVWNDLSTYTNNSTLVNAPTFDSSNSGSLLFDGTNEYSNVPINAVPTGNQITISCWTKFNVIQSSSIFSAFNSSGDRQINIHLPWSDSVVYWDCGAVGGTYDRINTSELTVTQKTGWHHWSFTKNATTGSMFIYLDGVIIASGTSKTATIGTISTNIYPCAIAYFGSATPLYYSGNIANMMFYNRALSATEVLQNYNTMKSRFGR